MNNNEKRIDEFLKFWRDIALQNPEYGFVLHEHPYENMFNGNPLSDIHGDPLANMYRELLNLGLPEDEKGKSIIEYFPEWVNHFKNSPSCYVCHSDNPKTNYFCYFASKDGMAYRSQEHLKIYIPLDSAHIKEGAKKIFEFLSSENISHTSKIGSEMRFDNIVVRLIKPKDAKKFINFINNDKYIQEGLLPANPFAFNTNGLAMAVDGHLSFNYTLANMIRLYMVEKKATNSLGTVGIEEFYQFVEKYIQTNFSTPEGIEKVLIDFNKGFKEGYDDSYDLLVNVKNVLELMSKVRKDDFTFDDYIEHYQKCSDLNFLESEKMKLKNIKNDNINNGVNVTNNEAEKEKLVILTIHEILEVMTKKYDINFARHNLIDYIKTGATSLLTRENNLRDKVSNSSFREDLKNILNKRGINLYEYLGTVSDAFVTYKEDCLEQAILETYSKQEKKYQEGSSNLSGKTFAMGALEKIVKQSDYTGFTRDNSARRNLQKNVSVLEVIDIVKNKFSADELSKVISINEVLNLIEKYVDIILEKELKKVK